MKKLIQAVVVVVLFALLGYGLATVNAEDTSQGPDYAMMDFEYVVAYPCVHEDTVIRILDKEGWAFYDYLWNIMDPLSCGVAVRPPAGSDRRALGEIYPYFYPAFTASGDAMGACPEANGLVDIAELRALRTAMENSGWVPLDDWVSRYFVDVCALSAYPPRNS